MGEYKIRLAPSDSKFILSIERENKGVDVSLNEADITEMVLHPKKFKARLLDPALYALDNAVDAKRYMLRGLLGDETEYRMMTPAQAKRLNAYGLDWALARACTNVGGRDRRQP